MNRASPAHWFLFTKSAFGNPFRCILHKLLTLRTHVFLMMFFTAKE